MNLTSITRHRPTKPPRVVVYGPDKVGKTTFALSAPHPIVIAAEDGLANFPDVPAFPTPQSFEDVLACLNTLGAEEHEFQTLVIDTLDWLEPLVWARTCVRNNWPHIEKPGFGKGYQEADKDWRELLYILNLLRDVKGMAIVCLAHFKLKPFNDPTAGQYDRYQIKLQERAAALVKEWADVIGFAHLEVTTKETEGPFNRVSVRGVGSGIRRLGVEERPAYQAGNRYGLPPVLPLDWQAFVAAYAEHARKSGAVAPMREPVPEMQESRPVVRPEHPDDFADFPTAAESADATIPF